MLGFIDLIIRTATKNNLNDISGSREEVLSYEFVERLIFSRSSIFDQLSTEAKSGYAIFMLFYTSSKEIKII